MVCDILLLNYDIESMHLMQMLLEEEGYRVAAVHLMQMSSQSMAGAIGWAKPKLVIYELFPSEESLRRWQEARLLANWRGPSLLMASVKDDKLGVVARVLYKPVSLEQLLQAVAEEIGAPRHAKRGHAK